MKFDFTSSLETCLRYLTLIWQIDIILSLTKILLLKEQFSQPYFIYLSQSIDFTSNTVFWNQMASKTTLVMHIIEPLQPFSLYNRRTTYLQFEPRVWEKGSEFDILMYAYKNYFYIIMIQSQSQLNILTKCIFQVL